MQTFTKYFGKGVMNFIITPLYLVRGTLMY